MGTLKNYILVQEENDWNKSLEILQSFSLINESVLTEIELQEGILDIISKVSGNIKKHITFIKELYDSIKNSIKLQFSEFLKLFKDPKSFSLFKALKFSVKYIVNLYKKGVKTWSSIENIIAKKIIDLGGVKYVQKNLHLLDEFFKEHPILKKIGGVAVAGLLLYIWLNMSYGINFEWSMSWEDMINALIGRFNLSDLFASESGVKMLIYFAVGSLTGISFPWPGSLMQQVTIGIIIGLYKVLKPKIKLKMPGK